MCVRLCAISCVSQVGGHFESVSCREPYSSIPKTDTACASCVSVFVCVCVISFVSQVGGQCESVSSKET